MKILSLESSAKAASVALSEDGKILARAFQCTGLTHSRTLLPMATALLENCDLTVDDIDIFAVAAGPGSFTGLRIGISAIKGLAWAADKPCCGVSTLEAMAENMAHMNATLICAMDARRNQIYNAVFTAKDGILTRITPDRAIALSELEAELRENTNPLFVIGDGAELCYNYLIAHNISCTLAPAHLRMQDACGVCTVAERMVAAGKTVSANDLEPVYLRSSQAERERMNK